MIERMDAFNWRMLLSCNWVAVFLIATFFTLPVSSTGKSISMALAIIAIVFNPENRQVFPEILKQAWCKWALALFAWALLACLWSPASMSGKLFVVEKYSKLLYLPLLVAGLRDAKLRLYCLNAFLAATLLTSVIAIGKFYGYLSFLKVNPEHVFRNHIMTGFMVSFACYMALYFFARPRKSPLISLSYLTLALIYSWHVLFVNGGRTGYIIFFLLMTLLLVQLLPLKKALVGVLGIALLAVTLFQFNENINQRVNAIAHEWHNYQHNQKGSSVGFRLQFHDFAQKLFIQHPIFGNGTSSFTYNFRILNPIPEWGHGLLEPHGQYWLTAAEFGVTGLILLAMLYLSLLKVIWRLHSTRIIGLGIMIPFLIGNLTDSLMFYSGSGYFFLLFMAICMGEAVERQTKVLLK